MEHTIACKSVRTRQETSHCGFVLQIAQDCAVGVNARETVTSRCLHFSTI
jgi:hypothetical protein